jgi:hypothetical protein
MTDDKQVTAKYVSAFFYLYLVNIECTCHKWIPATTAWRFFGLRMEEQPPIWRVVANILKKQLRTTDKGWFSNLGVGWGANKSSLWKIIFVTKYSQTKPRTWTDTLVQPKQRERDMRLGTWNVSSLYRSGSLKMDLQEVGCRCMDWIELAHLWIR